VIAPTVPKYDQASGDLRFSSILKILAQSYSVQFISLNPDPAEAESHYRRELEQLGIDVICGEFSFKKVFSSRQFAAVFIEFYLAAEYCLDQIRFLQPSCRVIVDSVDIHFYREEMKARLTGSDSDLAKVKDTKRRELSVYRRSDLVVAVTEDDAKIVRDEIPDLKIAIIPNIHRIIIKDTIREPNNLVFVGSFKHEPNVDAVKYFCQEVLPLILEQRPEIILNIVGGGATDELLALQSSNVVFHGFVPETAPYLERASISVAPLRFGAGMKGKIGEAISHGLPVVTTSVGTQGMGLVHEDNVMVGETPKEFAESIVRLMDTPDLYARVAENGRQYIRDRFSPERVASAILGAFEEARLLKPQSLSFVRKLKLVAKHVLVIVKNIFQSFNSRIKGAETKTC